MRYMRTAAIVALVLVFGASGLAKLVAAASFRDQFLHFGLPEWWVYVTGAVELLSAALIALSNQAPRRFGVAMLAATMAVATALHLLHDPIVLALPAFLLMLVAGYVAVMLRNEAATRAMVGA